MATLNAGWEVGPHGPVETLDERLLTVAGEIAMPLGNFPRRMTVVGLTGGRSAIWSAVPLDEPGMAAVEKVGTPTFLIVPGVAHRLDARAWLDRYPAMCVICPPGARDEVSEAVPVTATADILDDPGVIFEVVPGVGDKEAALTVRRPTGTTLILNDVLANVRHPHGLGAQVMARVFGFGVDAPRVPWLGKRMFVEDDAALGLAFRAWSRVPGLRRVVVSHGDVIDEDPAGVLARVACELGA